MRPDARRARRRRPAPIPGGWPTNCSADATGATTTWRCCCCATTGCGSGPIRARLDGVAAARRRHARPPLHRAHPALLGRGRGAATRCCWSCPNWSPTPWCTPRGTVRLDLTLRRGPAAGRGDRLLAPCARQAGESWTGRRPAAGGCCWSRRCRRPGARCRSAAASRCGARSPCCRASELGAADAGRPDGPSRSGEEALVMRARPRGAAVAPGRASWRCPWPPAEDDGRGSGAGLLRRRRRSVCCSRASTSRLEHSDKPLIEKKLKELCPRLHGGVRQRRARRGQPAAADGRP